MFSPHTGAQGLSPFGDEQRDLFLRRDCHERMEATINALHTLIAHASLPEQERQTLLFQLSHMLQHLRESLQMLVADTACRNN